jgi:hypothetical protein
MLAPFFLSLFDNLCVHTLTGFALTEFELSLLNDGLSLFARKYNESNAEKESRQHLRLLRFGRNPNYFIHQATRRPSNFETLPVPI